MSSTVSAINDAPLQFGFAPQTPEDKIAQDVRAALGVAHFRVKLHRENAPRGSSAADSELPVAPVT